MRATATAPDMRATKLPRRGLLCACLAAMLLLALAPSSALALQFGSFGEGAGQLSQPISVAVNQETGDIYVGDELNRRIDVFSSAGVFRFAFGWGVRDGTEELETCTTASGCRKGLTGGGVGEFAGGLGIAVDNSGGATEGDVYVADGGNNRIERFDAEGHFQLMIGGEVDQGPHHPGDLCTTTYIAEGDACGAGVEGAAAGQFEKLRWGRENPIAVGPSGTLWVGDLGRVQSFDAAGAPQSEFPVAGGAVRALAAAPGHLYLTANAKEIYPPQPEIRQYSPAGALEGTISLPSRTSQIYLATDAAGNLLADRYFENYQEFEQQILSYDPTLTQLLAIPPPGPESHHPNGLAFDEASGELVLPVSYEESGKRGCAISTEPLPPPGPVIFSQSAEALPPGRAGLTARVNPEGRETHYRFEYGPTSAYGASTPEVTLPSAGFETEEVEAEIEGLEPSTGYHYRLVAENERGEVLGEDETFESLPPVTVDSLSATGVTATEATLEAEIDPLGTNTAYYFEYEDVQGAIRTAEVDIGEGAEDVAVSVKVEGLSPATEYSYRVYAENSRGHAEAAAQLTTQPGAYPFALPDGRAWELVSPPDKGGAVIEPTSEEGGFTQASASGNAITYISKGATEAEPAGEPASEWVQSLARHTASGWRSEDIASPHAGPWGGYRLGYNSEYGLFSADLARAALEPVGFYPLSPYTTERTPYLRVQEGCEVAGGECYLPLLSSAPGHEDVVAGVAFGGDPEEPKFGVVHLEGGSPDLRHVVLLSGPPLTEAAVQAGAEHGLYEWSGGHLALASVLPSGEALSSCGAYLGAAADSPGADARHAVSADGSLVIWSPDAGCGAAPGGHLYLRDAESEQTLQLDAVQGGSGEGAPEAVYQDASANGKRVFFTDTQRLTAGSRAKNSNPDLYLYDLEAPEGERLTDLTVPVQAGEAGRVQGLIPGASEDGSSVYVVASGVLTSAPNRRGQSAVAGSPNLYLLREGEAGWSAAFIATLAGEDSTDWGSEGSASGNARLGWVSSRVSPNGRWLAFMSERPLTGYDNRDAASGARDQEDFLYDAASERLICASCNPTGARPRGILDTRLPLVDRGKLWNGKWLAGSLPDPYRFALGGALPHLPRYLSNSGRLFFNAADALVPQDTNGTEDAYEYEPAGVGGCAVSSPTYSPRSGGCASLISSGASAYESAFLDASSSGNDAFFLTSATLTPEDVSSSADVYDAHVCGVGWECTTPPQPQPPCEESASCHPASAQGNGAVTPGSSGFQGPEEGAAHPEKPGANGNAKACRAARHRAAKLRHAARRLRARAGHLHNATIARRLRHRAAGLAKRGRHLIAAKCKAESNHNKRRHKRYRANHDRRAAR